MRRLSGLDASFLYLETPTAHMHVGAVGIFDPATAVEPPSYELVVQLVRERIHLAPQFRQRMVEVPFALHHPVWVDDPDFDVEHHVHRAVVPAPGGDAELAQLAAEYFSQPLDRSRPLWDMLYVEGLAGGLVASITKTHHAAVDGVSGMDLTVALLDLTPEPAPVTPPEQEWQPEPIPNDFALVGHAITSLARQPVALAKTAVRTGRGVIDQTRRPRPAGLTPPPAPFSAPHTSFNTALSPYRKFAVASLPLAEVKAVKKAAGTTVNDVVLALVAGSLRNYLLERGEAVDQPLIANVPVSVRAPDQQGSLGNRISLMLTTLATDIDDPMERLAAIRAGTQGAKEQHQAIGANALQDWAEFAAPAMAARAARLYSRLRLANRHRPVFNVTVSNVPGPPFPLYSFGSKMVATYPMGPLSEGGGLNITVCSYLDSMFFGIVADRASVGDVNGLATGLHEALTELAKAALG